MGEDLIWAIRGGGGASFGVILAWKVQLVDVPNRVTVFSIDRSLEQNGTQLVHRWQYVAPQIDRDLFIGVIMNKVDRSISASFFSLFLGGTEKLIGIMQESFPELGLVREDCTEMSWIESTSFFDNVLLLPEPSHQRQERPYRTQPNPSSVKITSDYVRNPVPETGLRGIERLLHEPEADQFFVFMYPHGGKISEISESATPFPHRAGALYILGGGLCWNEKEDSAKYINWSRKYYNYLAPYVSRSPRAAHLNFRDLDIGVNNPDGNTSYEQASVWGFKYFMNNFDRLVQVKTMVDPHNFFKNEQSIPPLQSS